MEKDYHADASVERRTELFNRHVWSHRNLIYKLCIRYSYSAGDVEDNYNEVLINFFRYIETYDPSRSIQTWLHIVAKRFIADLNHRSSAFRRSEDVDVSTVAGSISEKTESGENCMGMDNYRQHYSDEVLAALDRLKPTHREALLLQQAGYRLSEIAEISHRNGNLKIKNVETVKSRL
ncbi:RNA polymerase sigma factor, partial [Viscerimonas tarda]